MISGSSLVLFLFLVPMGVLSDEITKECGENLEIPAGGITSRTAGLKAYDGTVWSVLLSINETHGSPCTENEKYCIQFAEGGTQMTLTVRSVTFEDQGKYTLYHTSTFLISQIFYIRVTGACEPNLSASTDNLTCEVDVESAHKAEIVWMDKHRKIYQKETFTEKVAEKFTKLQDTFKLTDESKKVEMCCTVFYKKGGKKEEKQNCQIRPSHVGAGEVMDTNNKRIIIIPILCVLVLAIVVALFILLSRRMSFTQKNREDHRVENMEGSPSEPLQRPQDQV
ncbi:uncharacterized protein LOC120919077 isoform X2 [Rana temporaria]|uniref:uncharacterized protein LOC120919077 isoform X2 n=1 Tax=Rana temporaria TaxID=8407 RepID=UPI001AAE1472|nr:uncharacterized protein LOC120919077 isoform X2 [Rana temporaria]